MNRFVIVLSFLLSCIGFKALANDLDLRTNSLILELRKSGLTVDEIVKLDELSKVDPATFRKAVEQDFRIIGKLKLEMLSSANKGGGPCVLGIGE